MKKSLSIFISVIICLFALSSCGTVNTGKTEYTNTCVFSINCKTVLDNRENLNKDKTDIVPDDGIILAESEVGFNEGETVYDVLLRVCRENKIHIDSEITPAYNSAYIKGMGNLYSGDCGEYSGWVYKVNGESAQVGANSFTLSNGDKVEWCFICDFSTEY